MWRWFKLAFKYRKRLITELKDFLDIVGVLVKYLKKQDWTDPSVDDYVERAQHRARELHVLLKRLGY